MKLRLFMGAFNTGDEIANTLESLLNLRALLQIMRVDLHVLLIDDASTDGTWEVMSQFQADHDLDWLSTVRNEENRGNAQVVMTGYQWALADADSETYVACCDADGEHDPLEIAIRLRRHLLSGDCDSVIGTINYPDHMASAVDRAGMRVLGELQAHAAGAIGPFYVHSPGFQIHRASSIAPVINDLLQRYVEFYTRFRDGKLPRWGIHGVILHLYGTVDATVQSVYLACYRRVPNRSLDKLREQMRAGFTHLAVVDEFLALPGN